MRWNSLQKNKKNKKTKTINTLLFFTIHINNLRKRKLRVKLTQMIKTAMPTKSGDCLNVILLHLPQL